MHPQTWGLGAALATFAFFFFTATCLRLFDRNSLPVRVGRLGCIDGLRGYLALGVFFHHFLITYNYRTTGKWASLGAGFFPNCGEAAVSLFFMITGFLFLSRLLEGRPIHWGRFYTARVFRLFPLYLLCVAALFIIVLAIGGAELQETPFVLFQKVTAWLLFLTPGVNRFPDTGAIMGQIWTLRYEWLFYLALPGIAWMLRSRSKLPLGVLAALTLYFFLRPFTVPVLGESTKYFALFWMGGLAAYAHPFEALKRRLRTPLFSGLALVALLTALFAFDDVLQTVPVLLLTLFFVPVALGNSLWGLLNLRASTLLGEISYSLYLLHGFMLYLVFSVFAPGALQVAAHPDRLWLWMPALCVAWVFAAWFSHRYIEQPGIALGKKLTTR